MGREYEEAAQFSENLDRLLAGQPYLTDDGLVEDTRTALDFARWMVSVRPAPSPAFQAGLKARLRQKMEEKESASRRGWFWRFIPQEPVWQVAVVMVLMLVVGGALWGTFFRPSGEITGVPPGMTASAPATLPPSTSVPQTTVPPTATQTPSATPWNGLMAFASNSKPVYAPGENVRIEVAFSNHFAQPLVLEDFPPAISLMDASTGLPIYTFVGEQSDKTLAPGETAAVSLDWDQKDNKGRPVPPGKYYVELETIESYGQNIPLNMAQPAVFDILPSASGEAGRLLEVEQSQTVASITVTLKQIEVTPGGLLVTAFITPPPDYVLLPGTPALQPSQNYPAAAGYSLDGAWVKDAGFSTVGYFGTGMEHTWYIPQALPDNAGFLTFIVHSVGEWEGPWQFEVSLDQ